MQVSGSIKQIKTRQAPIEIEFLEQEKCRTQRSVLLEEKKYRKLYSDNLALLRERIQRTVELAPKTVKFYTLPPVQKEADVAKRRELHRSSERNFLAENKTHVHKLDEEVNGPEDERTSYQRQIEREIKAKAREALQYPRVRVLKLQEEDIYTSKIDIVYLLQLFAHPFSFDSDFQTYLNHFTIGYEIGRIRRVSAHTRHQSTIFKDNSKYGIERAQQLRRADSYNNAALQAIEMLAKWCSGYSYLPLKSFQKPFDDYKEHIKKALKIKFLNKKQSAELPLFHVIPAGEAVDHLTFDHIEMDKLVRQVREQLDNNIWEPFVLFQQAEIVFKKMLESNAKSKGVAASYMRCEYENIIYKKFEADFVTLLQILAQEAKDNGNVDDQLHIVHVALNLSEVMAIVDKLKMSGKPDEAIKHKVGLRYDVAFKNIYIAKQNEYGQSKPLKKEISKFVVNGLEYNYGGSIRVIQDGEVVEEEIIELSDYNEQPAENTKPTEYAEQDEYEQLRIALEQEQKEEYVLKQMAEANAYEEADYQQVVDSAFTKVEEDYNAEQNDAAEYNAEEYVYIDEPAPQETLYSVIHEKKQECDEYAVELPIYEADEPELPAQEQEPEPAQQPELEYQPEQIYAPTEVLPVANPIEEQLPKDFFKPQTGFEQTQEPMASTSSTSSRRRHKKSADGMSDASGISEQSEPHSTDAKRSHRRKPEQPDDQYLEPSDLSRSSDRRRRHKRELPQMDVQATVEHHPLDYAAELPAELPPPEIPAEVPADFPEDVVEQQQEQAPAEAPVELPYEFPDPPAEMPPEEPDMPPPDDLLPADGAEVLDDIASEDLKTGCSGSKCELMSSIDPNDLY